MSESFLMPRSELGGRTSDQISCRLVQAIWKVSNMGATSGGASGGARVRTGWTRVTGATGTLPEGGFGVHFGEERAGDLGEDGVEVGFDGNGEGACADVDFGDGVVGGGGFGNGPEEGVGLIGRR